MLESDQARLSAAAQAWIDAGPWALFRGEWRGQYADAVYAQLEVARQKHAKILAALEGLELAGVDASERDELDRIRAAREAEIEEYDGRRALLRQVVGAGDAFRSKPLVQWRAACAERPGPCVHQLASAVDCDLAAEAAGPLAGAVTRFVAALGTAAAEAAVVRARLQARRVVIENAQSSRDRSEAKAALKDVAQEALEVVMRALSAEMELVAAVDGLRRELAAGLELVPAEESCEDAALVPAWLWTRCARQLVGPRREAARARYSELTIGWPAWLREQDAPARDAEPAPPPSSASPREGGPDTATVPSRADAAPAAGLSSPPARSRRNPMATVPLDVVAAGAPPLGVAPPPDPSRIRATLPMDVVVPPDPGKPGRPWRRPRNTLALDPVDEGTAQGGASGRGSRYGALTDLRSTAPLDVAAVPEDAGIAWLRAATGERYEVSGARATIGTAPSCDVRLSGPGVAPEHARIEVRDGWHWLVDLRSGARTSVGGETVAEMPLKPGDVVEIGELRLRFGAPGAEPEPPPPLPQAPAAAQGARLWLWIGLGVVGLAAGVVAALWVLGV